MSAWKDSTTYTRDYPRGNVPKVWSLSLASVIRVLLIYNHRDHPNTWTMRVEPFGACLVLKSVSARDAKSAAEIAASSYLHSLHSRSIEILKEIKAMSEPASVSPATDQAQPKGE